jgi:hypothetical protein
MKKTLSKIDTFFGRNIYQPMPPVLLVQLETDIKVRILPPAPPAHIYCEAG